MREYLLVFLVAAGATYLLTVIAREVALRTGAVAEVRDRDVHAEPTPYFGGLAMLGGLTSAYLVAHELPFLSTHGPPTVVFHDARNVLIAGAMICAVGVLDDLFELDALTKLGGQVIAAGFLILNGIQYWYFPQSHGGQFLLDPAQGALLTAFVIVATINAVNFVDGLDGLATGVVGIGAIAFFVFCYQLTNLNNASLASTGALLSAMLGGACLGFLPHNFNPARLFMGDSGSMLIGLVLSASAITLTGQYSGSDLSRGAMGSPASLAPTFLPLALPVLLLIVPIADLVLAVIRRTRAGRSPFAPDKQHLHHRLLELGHSHRRAVLLLYFWSAVVSFAGVGLSFKGGHRLVIWTLVGLVVVGAVVSAVPSLRARARSGPTVGV
jgi:UDP-GlcNAc:undecaprenyl-phosphate/decaprenyl-phosphate GlcNAc-1-phosphate transferase